MVPKGVANCMIPSIMSNHKESDKDSFALAFETSGALGGVAVGRGDFVLETRIFHTPGNHAAELLPTIQALCRAHTVAPNSIGRVYVSIGPGSFTGLRVGITVARTLAFGLGTRIVPVSTLEVISQNAGDCDNPPRHAAVLLDAKRGRVYAATYERKNGRYVETSNPAELDPAEFLAAQDDKCAVLGEGVLAHRTTVEAARRRVLPESLFPARAETVYRLGSALAATGSFVEPRSLVPLYIRRPEAEENWERRHGSKSG